MTTQNKEKFSIAARSCTLISEQHENALISDWRYIVPVYQRPYSWGEKEIKRFLEGIFYSFENEEPCFMGTIQLIPKEDRSFEIVDGQQRLTTIALLFRLLALKGLEIPFQDFGWISTLVNKGGQQLHLNEALTKSIDEIWSSRQADGEGTNPHLRNLTFMDTLIDEASRTDETPESQILSGQFISYLCSELYFVVIETRAGLAKTLEIFNTINTAGMDLNGGDLFKIRMFEYMTRFQQYTDNDAFEKLDALYARVEQVNREKKSTVTTMPEVLDIYRRYLIGRYSGNSALHGLSADKFYERLFAVLLNNTKDDLIPAGKFRLDLDEVVRFVDVRVGYEQNYNSWYYMLWKTRYGNYWYLDCLYVYRFGEGDYFDRLRSFTQKLFRILAVPSLIYAKSVYRTHGDMHRLITYLSDPQHTEQDVQAYMDRIIHEYAAAYQGQLQTAVNSEYLLEPVRTKNLLCWLSAKLHEGDDFLLKGSAENWEDYFGRQVDIEHIQAINPEMDRKEIQDQWKVALNSLGNLVLFERSINRSNSNAEFTSKIKTYQNSAFKVVQRLANENSDGFWTVEKALSRKEAEAKKLIGFLLHDGVVK